MNVETSDDVWVPVRNIYMTIVLKLKVTMDESNPFSKKIILLPKNVEIANLKVLKDNEQMEME